MKKIFLLLSISIFLFSSISFANEKIDYKKITFQDNCVFSEIQKEDNAVKNIIKSSSEIENLIVIDKFNQVDNFLSVNKFKLIEYEKLLFVIDNSYVLYNINYLTKYNGLPYYFFIRNC